MQDIRWEQRFSNFRRALGRLEKALKLVSEKQLNELEIQGLIQCFEYTYELSWKVLKDYLKYQGNKEIIGARDTITEAFRSGLISDGETWMRMFKNRNETSHEYDETTAILVADAVVTIYYNLFKELETVMAAKINPNPPLLA